MHAYFQAVDRAVKLLNAGDAEALGLVGKKLGISGEEVKEQLMGVKLFDNEGNKTVGFNVGNPNSLMGNLELTAKAAYDFKIVPQALDVKTLYDDSLVAAM